MLKTKYQKCILSYLIACIMLLFLASCSNNNQELETTSTTESSENKQDIVYDQAEGQTEEHYESSDEIVSVTVSDELFATDTVFWSVIPSLYTCAYDYSDNIADTNLLFCQYYRSKRDKFLSGQWNALAGNINYEFVADVESVFENGDNENTLSALTTRGFFLEPVSGEQIELSHFFASLNLLTKKRQSALDSGNTTTIHPLFDMGTWAGDCLELANDLISEGSSGLSDEELYNRTKELLGSSQGHFNRDNLLADIDSYNIMCLLSSDFDNLVNAMQAYYSRLISGESRFTLFAENRFGDDADPAYIADTTTQMLLSTDNIYIPLLREELDIDIKDAEHLRVLNTIGSVFAEYISNNY